MSWYRVYFLSHSGDIRNVDEFEADGDAVATTFADRLHEAVSDVYAGYEVWHLSRRVAHRPSREMEGPALSFARVTERMQASLLRREEILQRSETAFSQSRLLLERMRDLRDVVNTRKHHAARGRESRDA